MSPNFDYQPRPKDDDTGAQLIGAALAFVIMLVVLYFIFVATVVIVTTAFSIAAVVWVIAYLLAGYAPVRFLGAVIISCIGLLLYLAITASIAFFVGVAHEDSQGFTGALAQAIFALRQDALATLSSVDTGKVSFVSLWGLRGHFDSLWIQLAAIATLHFPGLLMFSAAVSRFIGPPYEGLRGYLIACGVLLIALPVGLSTTIWLVAMYFKGSHA